MRYRGFGVSDMDDLEALAYIFVPEKNGMLGANGNFSVYNTLVIIIDERYRSYKYAIEIG